MSQVTNNEENGLLWGVYRPLDDEVSTTEISNWWKSYIQKDPEFALLGEEFSIVTPKNVYGGEVVGFVYKNLEYAIEILKKEAIPYCGAVCVPYYGTIGGKSKELIEAENSMGVAANSYRDIITTIFNKVVYGDHPLKECTNCKSLVSKRYIEKPCECPVCHTSFLTNEERIDRENALSLVHKTEIEVTNLRNNVFKSYPEERTGTCYLVGGRISE